MTNKNLPDMTDFDYPRVGTTYLEESIPKHLLKESRRKTMPVKEINLSEKEIEMECYNQEEEFVKVIRTKYVKEFIKQTIEDIEGGYEGEELLNRIKKRAGEKLI